MTIPDHVAIIMDGNGRWAKARGHNRLFGHIRGARVAKSIVEHSSSLGIKSLTLFAFSTENWFRPAEEVTFLMKLLKRHLNKERDTLLKNNIRFLCIGDLSRLPDNVKDVVMDTISATKNNTGMKVVFALSYGGRQEIVQATKVLADQVKRGLIEPDDIDEESLSRAMASSFLPDPDLIIRTSGEFRLSNFFLWQAAYSELYVLEKMWPEFTGHDLDLALEYFSNRQRRFGRVLKVTDKTAPLEDSLT